MKIRKYFEMENNEKGTFQIYNVAKSVFSDIFHFKYICITKDIKIENQLLRSLFQKFRKRI